MSRANQMNGLSLKSTDMLIEALEAFKDSAAEYPASVFNADEEETYDYLMSELVTIKEYIIAEARLA